MITVGWLAIVIVLILLLIAIRQKPNVGDRIDEGIKTGLIFMCGCIGGLILLYGLIRFVHWASYD